MTTRRLRRWVAAVSTAVAVGAPVLTTASPAAAQTSSFGTEYRSSVSSAGAQGNGASQDTDISRNGDVVVFESNATNLVVGDSNGLLDVYVRNRASKTTALVSVGLNGAPGNGLSSEPAVSGDGRYVAFQSQASNLVTGDTNAKHDVFVRDLVGRTTTRVSVAAGGAQPNAGSFNPSISADGRYVAFESAATNLLGPSTAYPTSNQIYVYDRVARTTKLVSTGPNGAGNDSSGSASISGDGGRIAFSSSATNLVSDDTNGRSDIFVGSPAYGTTSRVSTTIWGWQAAGGTQGSFGPDLAENGCALTFFSDASNLVSSDTNGAIDVFVKNLCGKPYVYRASVSSSGVQGNGPSVDPTISADGAKVAYISQATNLVSGDTNGRADVFVADANGPRRMSTDANGAQGNGHSFEPSLSGDGIWVVFDSLASNLVPGDTNGSSDVFVKNTRPPAVNA